VARVRHARGLEIVSASTNIIFISILVGRLPDPGDNAPGSSA
jgi:hypothetical protein